MRRRMETDAIFALFREANPIAAELIAGLARFKNFACERMLPIRIS